MIVQLDTENADRDLTSIVTVLTHTPSASDPMICQGLVLLGDGIKNLDGTGGNFELTATVGGQTIQPNPQVVAFGTEIRSAVWSTPFPVPANAAVILRVKSPNAADTDVDVTAYLYDIHAINAASGVVESNVLQIGGVVQSATDLKDFADAGYDPGTNKVQGVVLVDTTTTNSDMRGTDGANTTVPDAAGAVATFLGVAGANMTAIGTDSAAKVLVTPAQKLVTDASGYAAADVKLVKTVDADTAITARVDASTLAGKLAGITLLAKWLRGLFRKDAMDVTAKAEVNTGGGTFDEATDALEALRDTAPMGTAMRGTDGANTVVPDAAGTAAGLHAATDALITGLNDIDAAGVVTALMADTWFKQMRAFARGKVVIAGNVVTFYDTDDATPLQVFTLAAGGRTVA